MNLYRSFGTLMETWVTERGQCSDSEWLGKNDNHSRTPSSHFGRNPLLEIVDSGVETASSDMSYPVTSCSVSTGNIEIDTFSPEGEDNRLIQASPVLSSSSPSSVSSSSLHVRSTKPQKGSTVLHQKVEHALQRSYSENLKYTPVHFTKEKVLNQRYQAFSVCPTVDERFRRRYRASLDVRREDNVLKRQCRASAGRYTVDERLLQRSRSSAEHFTVDNLLNKQLRASIESLLADKDLMQQEPSKHYTVDEWLRLQSQAPSEHLTEDKVQKLSQASSTHHTMDEGLRRRSLTPSEHLTVGEVGEVLNRQSHTTSDGYTVVETLSRQTTAPSERLTADGELSEHSLTSSADEKFLRQSQASPDPLTGDDGQRLGLSRMGNPLAPMRQMHRRSISMISDEQTAHKRLEGLGEEEGTGLSPGLNYLEQVCQMLEEIARQQIHNRMLQMDMDALRGQQDMGQALYSCQSDSQGAEDISSCQSLENEDSAEHSSNKPSDRKEYPGHFRHQSASDSAIKTLNLRTLDLNHRGQHQSKDDLLTKPEADGKKKAEHMESKIKERNTMTKNWTFRIKHLRRHESILKDANSQQMQSSEKTSASEQLSQLFKRSKRKTRNDNGHNGVNSQDKASI